jgi:hypothetical protein
VNTDTKQAAKEIILDILQLAGGSFDGKTRLFKVFYFAHLYYWRDNGQVLSAHPIVRMPQGPGIDQSAEILGELARDGLIEVSSRHTGPYSTNVYVLRTRRERNYADPRIVSIQQAIDWAAGRSAAELSDETHEFSRSWKKAKDGDELDIYLDTLDEDEYQTMVSRVEAAKKLVEGIF